MTRTSYFRLENNDIRLALDQHQYKQSWLNMSLHSSAVSLYRVNKSMFFLLKFSEEQYLPVL